MSVSADETRVLPEVVMTPELAAAVAQALSTADVRNLIMAEAEKQLATKTQLDDDQAAAEKAAADKIAADAAAAAEIAKTNQTFTRTEVIGGKDYRFEAATEGELDRQVLNAYKVAYSLQQTPAETVTAPDPAAEAAAAEAKVLEKVELERKFKSGEITPAEYIQQSGALQDFLASQGISVDTLKTVVEKNQETADRDSWEAASERFRNSDLGSDWPGGERNRGLLGDKLAALGLVDEEDRVAALGKAWAAMKTARQYFPYGDADAPATVVDPAVEAAKAAAAKVLADATAADAARVAAAAKVRSMSSSLFGASSGTSGAPVVSPAVTAAKAVVPDNATPQEIIAAYNAEQIKNGIDPTTAFVDTYRSKKI